MATSGAASIEPPRTPGAGALFVQLVALVLAGAVAVATAGSASWNPGPLIAIAVMTIISDLTAVEAGISGMRISGTMLGLMLAAVLLGGAPAALLGVITIAIGSLRWRNSLRGLATNLVTYAWFPLVSAFFFRAAIQLLGMGKGDAGYYFLVLPTFLVGLLFSFVLVTGYCSYLSRRPLLQELRDGLMPVLAAELFSAILITAAVFLVTKTGTVGIVVLAVVLVIFQYLVGELLKSKQRAASSDARRPPMS